MHCESPPPSALPLRAEAPKRASSHCYDIGREVMRWFARSKRFVWKFVRPARTRPTRRPQRRGVEWLVRGVRAYFPIAPIHYLTVLIPNDRMMTLCFFPHFSSIPSLLSLLRQSLSQQLPAVGGGLRFINFLPSFVFFTPSQTSSFAANRGSKIPNPLQGRGLSTSYSFCFFGRSAWDHEIILYGHRSYLAFSYPFL